MASGLVQNEDALADVPLGYDFGYMLKLLRCEKLPPDIEQITRRS